MKNLLRINKSLILLGILIYPLFANTISYAQDLTTQSQQAVIQDVDGLRAEFKEYTQDPSSKKIKYEMILKSNIDSDRVRIVWTISGGGIFEVQEGYTIDKNTARGNIIVRKGQTYTIPIVVTVTSEGITELLGRAEAFLAESTYIATVRKNFAANSDAEVLPLTDAYLQARTLNLIFNIIVIILITAASLFALFIAIKRFIKWLDKDDRDIN